MEICFVSNFHKTYFFERIALELKGYGYNISWICFDKATENHLLKSFSHVLVLSRGLIDEHNGEEGDFKLNELISGDRYLRYQPNWAYKYLSEIQSPVRDFIKTNKLQYIFGETTHAHEILIQRLVNRFFQNEVFYLHPQSVRIPDKRFLFLADEFQSKIFNEESVCNVDWNEGYSLITAKRPRRVKQVDKELKSANSLNSKLNRILRFFSQKNIRKDMPSAVHNRFLRAKLALREEGNKVFYYFLKRNSFDEVKEKDYVIYTLHMQPEASVDVVGAYYDNQLTNIKNIWRILPQNYFLIVKEHTNAIGNRSHSFFKEVKKLRNCILIHEKTDSHLLLKNSKGVFTVSGTIAYEAALMEVPAFTFGNIFFNKLKNCSKIGLDTFRNIDNFNSLLIGQQIENERKLSIEEFSKFLYQRSFDGIVDPPLNSEDWNDENNMKQVARSFNKFLRFFE